MGGKTRSQTWTSGLWRAASAVILLCPALQGESVSALMQEQSLFSLLCLWLMLCWSMYLFCVQGALCMALAFLPPLRRLWPLAALAFFAAVSLLTRFSTDCTASALPGTIALTAQGLSLTRAPVRGPENSFTFSLSALALNAVTLSLAFPLMPRLTRKYLLAGYSDSARVPQKRGLPNGGLRGII